jgi:hypothetical protein
MPRANVIITKWSFSKDMTQPPDGAKWEVDPGGALVKVKGSYQW